jgi:EamA-like transporter family.
LFFRNVIVSIGAFILIIRDKSLVANAKDNKKDLLLRSIFGTIGILGNMYAVDHIPLSDASMLNKMSPFFAIVFSYFILKEKINLFQALVLLGALGGCMLVVKPTFSNTNLAASLIGFFAGTSAGLGYTFVRKLGSKGVNGVFIVFFLSVFSVIATSPFLIFDF